MSIIHEALKKAQQKSETSPPSSEIKDYSFTESPLFFKGRKIVIGSISLVGISFIMAILFFLPGENDLGQTSFSESENPAPIEKNTKAVLFTPVLQNLSSGQNQSVLDKGISMLESENLVQAEMYFLEAVALNPFSPEAHNGLGFLYKKQDRREKAGEHYREAIRLKPDYAEAFNNLGVLMDQTGEIQEAQILFQKALHLRPGYSDAHLNFAISLERAGFLEKAKKQYEQFLSYAPTEQAGLVEKIKTRLKHL